MLPAQFHPATILLRTGAVFKRSAACKAALQAACATTQGVMVFDLSHFDYRGCEGFWSIFAEAFRDPAQPPHATPELLAKLRKDHASQKAAGLVEPPVIIRGGIPGTGL